MVKRSLLLAALLALSCGDGEDSLDKDKVTNIPPGTAKGSAYSGEYRVTLTTTSCAGTCPVFLGGLYAICKEGASDTENATVTQQDGKLTVHSKGLMVNSVSGGVNADGNFDVGGFGTQQSGKVAVTARVSGTIAKSGAITGTARTRGNGVVNDGATDVTIACTASYALSGKKK